MAKGRRLTSSRTERFLGTYAHPHASAGDPSELREEDIWSTADDADATAYHGDWEPRAIADGGGGGSYRRWIPRDGNRNVGGLSLAFEDPASNAAAVPRVVHQTHPRDGAATASSARGMHMATSAPVNVPDWSKILRVDSVESLHAGAEDDGFDDSELEMVPPHEYLARSRKATANSVFEGVGRTLKGRDLSRVRDAVWSQTGFDG